MTHTLKVTYPEWQGGVNPNYMLGAKIMELVVPDSQHIEEIEIPVATDNKKDMLQRSQGVDALKVLQAQTQAFSAILNTKEPDKVITIGGDCAVSLAPFNYLSRKYGANLGIIWLDAHPDISTTEQSHHLHEMVVSSLIGRGGSDFNVKYPVDKRQILLAGLVKKALRDIDSHVNDYNMQCLTPKQLRRNPTLISNWIKKNNFTRIAVHFDLDVLSPDSYRSIYPAEPGLNRNEFTAAIGKLSLENVGRLLQEIDNNSDLVGLTVAENMAWDALRLREQLAKLSLFD
ncbi:Arginase [Lactiplantibacillus pentosus KCA1]|nr:arginase family protein [Lactiplantibacillus pentosus]EIW13856.1 Arginase [Lactiplantibacillus pentosus KCA1]